MKESYRFPLGLLELLLRFISLRGSETPLFGGFYVKVFHKILKVLLFFLGNNQLDFGNEFPRLNRFRSFSVSPGYLLVERREVFSYNL